MNNADNTAGASADAGPADTNSPSALASLNLAAAHSKNETRNYSCLLQWGSADACASVC
jgi:hypothetical protein